MIPGNIDLTVFNKFNFEYKPIGIKLQLAKPGSVKRLEKELSLCEMFKEAQQVDFPFYTDIKNHT
jgi:uncharacterized protein (DUF169 family)